MQNDYEIFEDSVRNTFGGVMWSHKIHEKQSDLYAKQYKSMETAKILAASLTSVGIVSLIFTDQIWVKILSALISFVSVFVSAFFRSFDLQNMISSHTSVAHKLLNKRDELKLLILRIRLEQDTVAVLMEQYNELVKQVDEIYSDAPRTTDKAVKQARIALNIKQDNRFSELEIDDSLPEKLRREGRE
ncbi:hypothetical protein EDD76_101245 [Kineothrix alysoides]|uniref:SMODS and SLOG-associating 2TM effector domain-containing protein n=1 Tax=Kineothrix alysoides TaxID=1469948 RepID=A0A4R1R6K0_9FIRM|nr:SLATT domain-containing protein [Kineothrix alysoides]TCL61148.1 hypothetical protein EDD76_101245 [Kineothrix alysoides]